MAEHTNVTGEGKTVDDLFAKRAGYSMPPFQRSYVWGEDNLEEYWGDLENLIEGEKSGETSFLGALVLQEGDAEGKSSKELKIYTVIDGQQRLTTFYLTLLALLAYAIERKQELHKQQEDKVHVDPREFHSWTKHAGSDDHRIYLFSREATSEGKVRLKPSLSDHAQFNFILSELIVGLKELEELTGERERAFPKLLNDTQKKTGNLVRAYRTLQKKIKFFIESDDDKAEWGARYGKAYDALILRTEVVQIITGPNLSPYEIFDRLNTSGVRLGTLDWVRNYTFGKAILGKDDAEKSERFSTEVWRPFENRLKDVPIKPPLKLYENFFVAYGAINIENFSKGQKDLRLKKYWDKQIRISGEQKSYRGAELIVDSLDEYLPSYLALSAKKEPVAPPAKKDVGEIDPNLWVLIKNVKDLALPESTYPFLMSVIRSSMQKKGGLPAISAIQAFEIVESFVVRLTLLGRSMASLTSVFQPLWINCGAEEMTSESILRGIAEKYSLSWPDDDEIRDSLLKELVYSQKRLKYILAQYEKKLWESHPANEAALPLCEIDHIMSKKASEGEKERETLCSTLGNLTLLEKRINRLKSAKDFKEVKELLEKSQLLSVKELLKDFNRWDTDAIKQRNEELGEWAIKRWPLK